MSKRSLRSSQTVRMLFCLLAMPIFAFSGLIANAALAPGVSISSGLAAWMAIFVIYIFLPAHLAVQAVVFLMAKNRFFFKRPFLAMLAAGVLAASSVALLEISSPFAVFSITTVPFFLAAYVVASGRSDSEPNN